MWSPALEPECSLRALIGKGRASTGWAASSGESHSPELGGKEGRPLNALYPIFIGRNQSYPFYSNLLPVGCVILGESSPPTQ